MAEYELRDAEKIEEDAFRIDRESEKDEPKGYSEIKETSNRAIQSSGVAAKPAVTKNFVLFGACDYNFYCLDNKTGAVIWKFRTGGLNCGDPEVFENKVFFGSHDGYLYCLNVNTGEELWKFKTGDHIISRPLVLADMVIFCSLDGYIYALDQDGHLLWKRKLDGYAISQPKFANGTIYLSACDGNFYALSKDGFLLWKYRTGGANGTPTIVSKNVFFVSWDENLYCISTNGFLRWKFKINGPPQLTTEVSYENGCVYAGSGSLNNGTLYKIDESGFLVWQREMGGRIAVPIVYHGLVIAPSLDKNIYTFDINGSLKWKFCGNGPFFSAATGFDNKIYAGTLAGGFYCIDTGGNPLWNCYIAGPPLPTETLAPIQNFVNRIKKFFRFWKPEPKPPSVYEKTGIESRKDTTAYSIKHPYQMKETEYSADKEYGMKKDKKKSWFF